MHDDLDVNLIDGTGINLDDPLHSPLPSCSPLGSPPSPSFSIAYAQSTMIAREVYPNRKKPEKAFGQLMCYLGMRSRSNNDTKVRTLSFDRHGWNERGYRLVKNGDAKGGKPKINYIPFV